VEIDAAIYSFSIATERDRRAKPELAADGCGQPSRPIDKPASWVPLAQVPGRKSGRQQNAPPTSPARACADGDPVLAVQSTPAWALHRRVRPLDRRRRAATTRLEAVTR
jgi:hypothetical protein